MSIATFSHTKVKSYKTGKPTNCRCSVCRETELNVKRKGWHYQFQLKVNHIAKYNIHLLIVSQLGRKILQTAFLLGVFNVCYFYKNAFLTFFVVMIIFASLILIAYSFQYFNAFDMLYWNYSFWTLWLLCIFCVNFALCLAYLEGFVLDDDDYDELHLFSQIHRVLFSYSLNMHVYFEYTFMAYTTEI